MIGTGNLELKKLLSNKECEFVSLGYNCDVAYLLRYTGLRNKAYPFDWCITPNNSVLALLKNHFEDFLDIENLSYSEPHNATFFEGEGKQIVESDKVVVSACCSQHDMVFPHDFPNSNEETYLGVAKKYQKRISRFLSLLSSDNTVVFVVNYDDSSDNDEFSNELYSLLQLKSPNLNFYVVSLCELDRAIKSSTVKVISKSIRKKVQRFNQMLRRISS